MMAKHRAAQPDASADATGGPSPSLLLATWREWSSRDTFVRAGEQAELAGDTDRAVLTEGAAP